MVDVLQARSSSERVETLQNAAFHRPQGAAVAACGGGSHLASGSRVIADLAALLRCGLALEAPFARSVQPLVVTSGLWALCTECSSV